MIFNMTGGGKKIRGSATPEKVLDGETFMSEASKDVQAGAMPNIGAVNVTLNAGESYAPAEGYHNGAGAVTANSLASQTAGTAAAAQILTGYNAWVNGRLVEGSMANNGAVSQALNAGGSYTIPAGYHNGSGKVTANSLASQTAGTAAASDIAKGKTAWVGGSQLTGTKVPEGTATAADVVSGKTFQSAASEGLQTGTYDTSSVVKTATVSAEYVSLNVVRLTNVPGTVLGGYGFGSKYESSYTYYHYLYFHGSSGMQKRTASGNTYTANVSVSQSGSTVTLTSDSGLYNVGYPTSFTIYYRE